MNSCVSLSNNVIHKKQPFLLNSILLHPIFSSKNDIREAGVSPASSWLSSFPLMEQLKWRSLILMKKACKAEWSYSCFYQSVRRKSKVTRARDKFPVTRAMCKPLWLHLTHGASMLGAGLAFRSSHRALPSVLDPALCRSWSQAGPSRQFLALHRMRPGATPSKHPWTFGFVCKKTS